MRCCMSQKFFFELQIYNKISPELCLVKLLIFLPNRFAKTGEFRPSKAGPCLNKKNKKKLKNVLKKCYNLYKKKEKTEKYPQKALWFY